MKQEVLATLIKRVEMLEVECGDIVHQINEAARDAMKEHANSEIMSRRAYDLANAARQGRAIEGLIAVMRYMLGEAEKDTGESE